MQATEAPVKVRNLYSCFEELTEIGKRKGALNFAEGTPMYPSPDIFWECILEKPEAGQSGQLKAQNELGIPAQVPSDTTAPQTLPQSNSSHSADPKTALDRVHRLLKAYYWDKVANAQQYVSEQHIHVGNGADDLLSSFMRAYLPKGSQVVTFAPTYMYYFEVLQEMDVKINKVFLKKEGDRLTFCPKELRNAINPDVKLLLLNYPQNPTSWVLNAAEMESIRQICFEFPHLMVVSDEVYLNICTHATKFTSFSCLPDMFDRTLSIHSVGKTFSGNSGKHKFGYAIGPQKLLKHLEDYNARVGKQPLDVSLLQRLGNLLERATQPFDGFGSYYEWNHQEYQNKRQTVTNTLGKLGLDVLPSEGGYFVLLDVKSEVPAIPVRFFFENSQIPADYSGPERFGSYDEWEQACTTGNVTDRSPDYAFCYFWAEEKGLLLWPVSGFCDYRSPEVPAPHHRALGTLVRVSLTRDAAYFENLVLWVEQTLQKSGKSACSYYF